MRYGDSLIHAEAVRLNDAQFALTFEIPFVTDWRRTRTFILLDSSGKPLYRKTLNRLGIHMRKKDTLTINWVIGKGE
jgi:hypothetical protein